jgi:hypothetical protein
MYIAGISLPDHKLFRFAIKIIVMMRKLFYLMLVVIIASCGDEESDRADGFSETSKTPEDSLFQEVMDGHDAAMAKMGKLGGYRKKLQQKIDSLERVSSSAKVSMEKKLKELKGELQDAEADMNKWMEEFSIDSAQDDMERRLKYLESENDKVKKVKEKILEGLAKADSLLSK